MAVLINNTSPPTAANQATSSYDVPEAEIAVGTIEIGDQDGKILPPATAGVWDDCVVVNRYAHRHGRYMAGISSPNGFNGQSVAFFQMWNPTLLLISDWTAQASNRQPEIPNPEPQDSDLVLLGDFPELRNVEVAGDSVTPVYRISGVYVYGFKNPKASVYEDAVYPRPPWLKDDFDRSVREDAPQGNIIDGTGGGA
jgi:hypothetical protein